MANRKWKKVITTDDLPLNNVIQGVQVNGNDLTISNNKVNIVNDYLMKTTTIDCSSLDQDSWYPVTISLSPAIPTRIEIYSHSASVDLTWSTHGQKRLSISKKIIETIGSGWGANQTFTNVYVNNVTWVTVDPVQKMGQVTQNSTWYVYVRGGGTYTFRCSNNLVPTLHTTDYAVTISGTTYATLSILTSIPNDLIKVNIAKTSDINPQIYAGASGSIANSVTTNGNTYIKQTNNGSYKNQIKIVGTGSTTVTSDANGTITINSTDFQSQISDNATRIEEVQQSIPNVPTKLSEFTDDVVSGSYLPLAGGTMNNGSQISRAGYSSPWVDGRNYAMIRQTTIAGYSPLFSTKTADGTWELGPYTNNILHLSYITDTNYASSNNIQTADFQFQSDGTINATKFVKRGGTSSQFLKADGTVDSSSYLKSGSVSDKTVHIYTTKTSSYDGSFTLNKSTDTDIYIPINENINTIIGEATASGSYTSGSYTFASYVNISPVVQNGMDSESTEAYTNYCIISFYPTEDIYCGNATKIKLQAIDSGFNIHFYNTIDSNINIQQTYFRKNKPYTILIRHEQAFLLNYPFNIESTKNVLQWGTSTNIATIDGEYIGVVMPSNPNTHYTSSLVVGAINASSNTSSIGNPFINIKDDSIVRGGVQFVGKNGINISSSYNSTDNHPIIQLHNNIIATGSLTLSYSGTNNSTIILSGSDTHVTAVGNHYTPSTSNNSYFTAGVNSGSYIYRIQKDAAGHVTGISTNQIVKTILLNADGGNDVTSVAQFISSIIDKIGDVIKDGYTIFEFLYKRGAQDLFTGIAVSGTDFSITIQSLLESIITNSQINTTEYKFHFGAAYPCVDSDGNGTTSNISFRAITSVIDGDYNSPIISGDFGATMSNMIATSISRTGFDIEVVVNKIQSDLFVHYNITGMTT